MKILFLDIDGVLNNEKDIVALHDGYKNKSRKELFKKVMELGYGVCYPFSRDNLDNLKIILEKEDMKIVLTSTWRGDPEMRESFLKALDSINCRDRYIGRTASKYWNSKWGRGREIFEWLEENNELDSKYIVFDDDRDMDWEDIMNHFIQINRMVGITKEDVEKGIEILNKK